MVLLKHLATTFFTLLFLISQSSAQTPWDFCVGDLSLPTGPTGYACKDATKVGIDDFVYSGLGVAANTSNDFKLGVTEAFAPQFPGLNGLGIAMARADMDVGGVIPFHTHRVSEILIVMKGTVLAGFIDSNNNAYYKVLKEGDIIVLPPSLIHFTANIGKTPALAFASFNSANPGLQIVSNALFQNNLPTKLIEALTLLDPAQIKKLKKHFGGTN